MKLVKFGVSRHFLENAWWNGLTIDMLICPHHCQKWLDFGYVLLMFLILALFWLRGMAWIWHAYVSWPPPEQIRFWLWSVDFPQFGSARSRLSQNAGSISGLASSQAHEAGIQSCSNHTSPWPRPIKPRRVRILRRPRPISELPLGIWEPWMEEVPKWWILCLGDESTSVVCRNTDLRVLLNPTSSVLLQARAANSSSPVPNPA